ncbi:efflux RND transporter periplasmic adaptor subunit [Roseomonas sp. E05]|uniref:efflux RND transporter periplasmic adaptor subunit n=1 Tax=Roseomonas sp. E05 TaxID=3046310 RepID=UPI0024BAF04E|nr:efflux RND transporter periplasmic adaptor subunit [Roseomonas sp. E05]MDJ0387977.1 efflux RND transporter periplasmic adaptor subunit [Roseomonas sp. E05]
MPDHNPPAQTVAPRSTTRRRWPLLLGFLLIVGLGGVMVPRLLQRAEAPPGPAAPQEPPPALTVTLAAVQARDLARPVIGDGSVVPWQELVIGAEAGGLRVQAVPVEEGDRVRAGQLLVALDDALPAAQVAQAEAAAAEAEAALGIAQADLRRASQLSRSDNVAQQVLEQRQAAARQAEARLRAARAQLQEAQARLAQARILAPADGTVLRRAVLPGAVVQPGQELVRLLREGRLELDARVPELDLAAVRPGQAVRVRHGEREIMGEVRALAPVVAGETRLGLVHVTLPPDSGLRPGMFARAEILPAPAPSLAVPQAAVVFRDGQPVVFVLPEGAERVEPRAITTGIRREGVVEVTGGLAPGERVVATGAGFLSAGDRVRVAAPR